MKEREKKREKGQKEGRMTRYKRVENNKDVE